MRMRVVLLTVIVVLLFSTSAAQAQNGETLPEVGQVALRFGSGLQPDVLNFPEELQISFLIQEGRDYVSDLDVSKLELYEDGYRIALNDSMLLKSTPLPMRFTVALDTGAQIPTPEDFEALVAAIGIDPEFGRDQWVFCAPTLPEVCTEPLSSSNISLRQIHGRLFPRSEIQQDAVYDWGSVLSEVEPIGFGSTLAEALLSSGGEDKLPTVIVILKTRSGGSRPYVDNNTVADLAASGARIVMINLPNDRGDMAFYRELRNRLQRLDAQYYEVGGVHHWPDLLPEAMRRMRPRLYTITYASRLFRDLEPHHIILGYVDRDRGEESWVRSEFNFLSQPGGGANSEAALRPLVKVLDWGLVLTILGFTLLVMIVSVDEPGPRPGNGGETANEMPGPHEPNAPQPPVPEDGSGGSAGQGRVTETEDDLYFHHYVEDK